jgi:2-polyprenyl-3-methyl-5-hydroxy-6-metoxy-1,4-benzoquinol methylase
MSDEASVLSGRFARRFPREFVQRIAAPLDQDARDESAVPSYCHWNPAIRWLMFRRLDVALGMVDRVLGGGRPGKPVAGLDFGCGVGMLMPVLGPALGTLYACDEQLAPARATAAHFGIGNVTWLEPGDLEKIPDASLSVVVALDVLEHVDGLDATLALFRRKLRRDGGVIVSGPTENGLYRLGRRIAGFSGAYHVRSVFDVERAVEGAGFALERVRRLPLPVPFTLFRITLWRPAG